MEDIILPDEEIGNGFEASDSFFSGNYPIQNNEYSVMLYGEKSAGEVQEIAVETIVAPTLISRAIDYDTFRVVALLSKYTEHLRKITTRFPDFIGCLGSNTLSNEHIEDLKQFHEAMLLDEKLRNEYRTIA